MKNKFFSMPGVLTGLLVLQVILLLGLFLYAIFAYCPVMQSEQMYQPDNIKLLNAKVELLQKHESWTIEILGIAFALTAVLIGLIQWYLSQKSENLINKKISGAEDKIYEELTQIWNMDKVAFKKSIDMKAVELSLMADYPIYIISDERGEKSNSTKLYNMLIEFHFEKVERITYKEAKKIGDFCEKSVVVFCDPNTKNNDKRGEDRILVEKLLAKNSHLGVFGFVIHYDDSFKKIFNDNGCISFAQFPSQVYNNLMSLLHYKRYLNSIK